jgi:hypothetical protein
MTGLYIVIGVLIAVILLLAFAMLRPKLKQYRLMVKKIEPQKKRRTKPMKKKKKSVWIKVI